jgi:2'-5' RNA ligase
MQPANWFIALVVPEQAGWIQVAMGLPDGVRCFHPEDLHITVAFLGQVGEERARAAWNGLNHSCHPEIPVSAGEWLALGHPSRPTAFGLGLSEGREAVAEVMRRWGAAALAAAGRPGDHRPPLPHVTLARPTRRGGETARTAMQQWITAARIPETPALLKHLALFTWAENREERLFRVVAQRQLDAEV